jgi:hypothetical protein
MRDEHHERSEWFADAELVLLAITATLAAVLDVESTVHAQRDPEAVEVNSWIYGERPSRHRMYGISLPVTIGFAYLGHRLKKMYPSGPNSWAWRAPLTALTLGHGAAAIANFINFGTPRKEPPNTAREH